MCLKITCEWQHWLLIFYNVVSKNKRENDKNTFMKDLSFLWRQSFSADLSVEPTVAVDAQVLVLLDHINILSQDRHRPCSRPPPSEVDRQFPGLIRVQKQMTPPTTCGKVIPLTWSCYFSVCVWCLWDLISTLWIISGTQLWLWVQKPRPPDQILFVSGKKAKSAYFKLVMQS